MACNKSAFKIESVFQICFTTTAISVFLPKAEFDWHNKRVSDKLCLVQKSD